MSKIIKHSDKRLRESYSEIIHESGLKAYLIPKDFSTTYAVVGVPCGGLNNSFFKDGKRYSFPFGMAHFLEHKLFANPDGEDLFEKIAESGAYCNAYTSFDKTAYLFSISGDIKKPLEILLEGFTTPYFTRANVKNEAMIISEEVKMYLDDPYDSLFFAMLGAMYNNPNCKQSVCGSVESVCSITPKMLHQYYDAFYSPDSAVLCIAGKATEDEVIEILDRVFKKEHSKTSKGVKKDLTPEDEGVRKSFVFLENSIPIPIFNLGIKITPPDKENVRERLRHDVACNMICEHYFSECDEFISSFFESGELSHPIKFSYDSAENISLISLYGETEDWQQITSRIKDHIISLKDTPIDDDELTILKRVVLSHHLATFDSTGDIANEFLSYALEGFDILDLPDLINGIDTDYINSIINRSFKKENICVAIAAQSKED